MPKQTPVESAYQKPREKNGWGGCASIGLFVVLALILGTLMSADTAQVNEKAEKEKVLSGQAYHALSTTKVPNHADGYDPSLHKNGISDKDVTFPTFVREVDVRSKTGQVPTKTQSGVNPEYTHGLRGKNGDDQNDLYSLVDVTTESIKKAEQDEVKKEKSMLSGALSSMGSGIYSVVARLWGDAGDSVDQSKVQTIADEIKAEVEKVILEDLNEEAEEIEEEVIGEINQNVELEEGNGVAIDKIENDVWEHEKQALSTVRSRIDDRAQDIKSDLKKRTAMIEKEMMEKKLSEQLGYEVKLQIVGDQVSYQPPPPPKQNLYAPQQSQYYPPQQNQQLGNGGGVQYQPPPGQYNGGAVQYQPPPGQNSGAAGQYGQNYAPPQSQGQYAQSEGQYGNSNNNYLPPQSPYTQNKYQPPQNPTNNQNQYRPPQSYPQGNTGN